MPDLCSILDPVPLKWRFTTATAVPLIVGLILFPLVGFWSIAASSLIAVTGIWMLGRRQTRYFLRTAVGILRTRAIDRRHRLPVEGPREQQRIAHAVNRLADSVEQTLAESRRNRHYHEDDPERFDGRDSSGRCGRDIAVRKPGRVRNVGVRNRCSRVQVDSRWRPRLGSSKLTKP